MSFSRKPAFMAASYKSSMLPKYAQSTNNVAGLAASLASCLRRRFTHFDFGKLQPQIIQDHGSENHSRNSHQPFTNNQGKQRQPDWIADPVADYFAIQEIFQFVN